MNRLKHLLRQNWKMALVIGLIEVLIVAIAPSPISANVYLGGYSQLTPSAVSSLTE
jgi:hypothetical protein